MVKNYYKIFIFVFVTLALFGFITPMLISAENNAGPVLGTFLVFGMYVPYCIHRAVKLFKTFKEKRKEDEEKNDENND